MKKEKCNCHQCKIEWDKDEHEYLPYCWEHDVWLAFDKRAKVFIEPEHAYRSMICFEHGRPDNTY